VTFRHAATAAKKADDEVSEQLTAAAEFAANFLGARRKARVASPPSDERINERLARYDFHAPCDVSEVAADLFDLLGTCAVRSDHPMYFGLFNQDRCVRAIEAAVVASGAAWISSAALKGRLVLRACITSYETTARDVEALLELLDDIRTSIAAPKNHP
jgi:hypothetical protein